MRQALLLLVASSLALVPAALWPVRGQPVWLALPAGAWVGAMTADPDWRVVRVARLGPLAAVLAAPVTGGADPMRLARAAGARLVTLAGPIPACADR